jgi:hypothetical protein
MSLFQAITKSVEECFSDSDAKYSLKTQPWDKNCSTLSIGGTSVCLRHFLRRNCPKYENDDECVRNGAFLDCVETHQFIIR